MQTNKTLLKVAQDSVDELFEQYGETGMGFLIVETGARYVAIMTNGDALPLFLDPIHYDIEDLLAGNQIPDVRHTSNLVVTSAASTRTAALVNLSSASVSPKYTGSAGALPLVFSDTLLSDTVFVRSLSMAKDPRYDPVSMMLSAGTYLTTGLDRLFVNSGFGVVGRYALPIPLPASHVIEYELPAGTSILVGTVAPMFGQAGGGVEVQIVSAVSPTLLSTSVIPNY